MFFRSIEGRVIWSGEVRTIAEAIAALDGAGLVDVAVWPEAIERAAREGVSLEGAPLDGLDLAGVTLKNVSLRSASLRRTKLGGAWLDGATLSGADLSGAQIDKAFLDRCDLTRARLDGASARGASFVRAVAPGASFEECDLGEAIFTHANLLQANLDRSRSRGARFDGAQLGSATARQANLDRCSFVDALMFRIDLRGAQVSREALSRARDLREAMLPEPEPQVQGVVSTTGCVREARTPRVANRIDAIRRTRAFFASEVSRAADPAAAAALGEAVCESISRAEGPDFWARFASASILELVFEAARRDDRVRALLTFRIAAAAEVDRVRIAV